MKKYLMENSGEYMLISQKGVTQYVFPEESMHNAIWDTSLSPSGELYFALATELSTAGYVRLCRYNYAQNKVDVLFGAEDVIMPSDRAIRASKFHTSISFMNDGKMVMTTHTTDKSPRHPSWMPIQYYHHVWEGFAGGNIVIYDPVSGKAENLGIPVPHETIYGSIYDSATNALFFTGGFRGHAYRYSFDDKKLTDFGQQTENWSFRLLFDKYGKIYSNSRSGYMYNIDPQTLKIEDLDFRQPFQTYPEYDADYKMLSNGGIGPDGRLYMCYAYSRKFVAYDSDRNEFEIIGDYLPTECHVKGETRHGIYGMDFDSEGVLWYAVFSRNCGSGQHEKGFPSSLFRWDIARGGSPEWLGVIGTEERGAAWTSEICISDDDILYCMGSNHLMDGPDITAIDLKQYRKGMYDFGRTLCRDEYFAEPTSERYIRDSEFMFGMEKIAEENDWKVPLEFAYEPVRLWRALAPSAIEDSPVKMLCWTGKETLSGICGTAAYYVFKIINGKLAEIIPASECKEEYEILLKRMPSVDHEAYAGLRLPYYPGRQYKAVPAAETIYGNKKVVGTVDGMLAICEGKSVFGLGPAVYNGPVRCLCTAPDGSAVYGTGGDEDDIGILFRYDDERGLCWLGHVAYDRPAAFSPINCPVLTSCAISSDSKILAVGSGDRLGTVVFYSI